MHLAPGPWHADGTTVKAVDHGKAYTLANVNGSRLTPEARRAAALAMSQLPAVVRALYRIATHPRGMHDGDASELGDLAREALRLIPESHVF